MQYRYQHRNSQKRYYEENSIYFIVTKTFQNFPYFKEPIFCELFIEELKLCKELEKFKLYGFCIIYDHLNLLIHPNSEFNISKIMKSLKENSSRDINYVISGYRHEGDTSTCRLRLRELIDDFHNQFIQKYGQNQNIIPKFKWQKSFYDHIINDDDSLNKIRKYIINNPTNWLEDEENINKN